MLRSSWAIEDEEEDDGSEMMCLKFAGESPDEKLEFFKLDLIGLLVMFRFVNQ